MKNASVTFWLLWHIYAILLNNLLRGSIAVCLFLQGENTYDSYMLLIPLYYKHLSCLKCSAFINLVEISI